MDSFPFIQLREITVWDTLDVLIIWAISFGVLRTIQGSRAMRMALGLLALFMVQLMAQRLGLVVLSKMVGSLFNIIPIAILVLFQEEIRSLLVSLGRTPFVTRSKETDEEVLESIFQAVLYFAKHRIGALLVFQREDYAEDQIEGGTKLDARPSYELLLDIFQTKSMLHDGAVVVTGSRLDKAGCVLPLSKNQKLPKHWGTRHRAAIGMSEQSDAVVLVVSEESGNISLASDGQMYLLGEHSMTQLQKLFHSLNETEEKQEQPLFEGLWKFTRKLTKSKVQNKSKESEATE
jgi:diadenylate cyclase